MRRLSRAKYDQGELQQHFDTYKAGVTLKMVLTKVKKEELGNNFTDGRRGPKYGGQLTEAIVREAFAQAK